jgi:uncharacterized membrane protein YdbT with pleckstrin-like domain
MASYVEEALVKGEKTVHTGQISVWSLAGPIALGALLLPLFGIGLLCWLYAYAKYRSTELAITNRRIIAKCGLVSRRTIEINIKRVESIQVDQSVFGRIFDFGTLVISGAGDPQAPIPGISSPMSFRRAFIDAQDLAQSGA